MFELKNKTILLISPNKWGKMQISKHHYAIELAKRGNIVYFLNPPCYTLTQNIEIISIQSNLFSLSYKPIFPFKIRFHFRLLFDFLIRFQIKKILKRIPNKPDIVWSFETNLFSDLSMFKTDYKIYHPVDMIVGKYQNKIIRSADVVFSVSDIILNEIKRYTKKTPSYFINHGLSLTYANHASKILPENKKKNKVNACYIGNLLLSSLDRRAFQKIIELNTNINFTFFGSYKPEETNVGGTNTTESKKFISFLKNSSNVNLKGVKSPSEIIKNISNYDIFVVLLDTKQDINAGSNSHKIMEYLSFGKVIISSRISQYKKYPGLIEMVDERHNENLAALFKKVINNLDYYNSPELQRKRIDFALNNTCEKQIERIEKYISKNYSLLFIKK